MITLPDDIINEVQELCDQAVSKQIAIGYAVWRWMKQAGVKHGEKMQAYDAFADVVYQRTGEAVTGNTIRKWKHAADLMEEVGDRYQAMPYAVFLEAVNLSSPGQNEIMILDWAIENLPTVPQLRAHWLPQTSADTYAQPDAPAVAALVRSFRRMLPEGDPRWAIAQPLIETLRKLFAEWTAKDNSAE